MAQALEGIFVLDFTQVMAGPFCSMLLGDLGAEVVKVEPMRGDTTRKTGHGTEGNSAAFAAVNRNKRSICLDLRHPSGCQIARQLANKADIIVENFRPGIMATYGLDFATLSQENPGLVYASISGFGESGPYARRGGFDLIAQGMSGIMSVTGYEGMSPVKCGIPVTDLGAGLLALYGILAALFHRERTGLGQKVESSLLEAGIALSVWEVAQLFSGEGVPAPTGSAHRLFAPYQAFRCRDGYINIGAANVRTWEKFASICGHPEWCKDARFYGMADRVANREALAAEIEAVMREHPRAYWLEQCEKAGVPAGPILDYTEVFDDPHVRARQLIWEYEEPGGGSTRIIRNPVQLSATPPMLLHNPPTLGQHTEDILTSLGYDQAEISRLFEVGAVG